MMMYVYGMMGQWGVVTESDIRRACSLSFEIEIEACLPRQRWARLAGQLRQQQGRGPADGRPVARS
jgi:hypothetical protein